MSLVLRLRVLRLTDLMPSRLISDHLFVLMIDKIYTVLAVNVVKRYRYIVLYIIKKMFISNVLIVCKT